MGHIICDIAHTNDLVHINVDGQEGLGQTEYLVVN